MHVSEPASRKIKKEAKYMLGLLTNGYSNGDIKQQEMSLIFLMHCTRTLGNKNTSTAKSMHFPNQLLQPLYYEINYWI
jgi:hypothetical protein